MGKMTDAAIDAVLRLIGVIAKPQPATPRPPVVYGWTPSKPGEEPPF